MVISRGGGVGTGVGGGVATTTTGGGMGVALTTTGSGVAGGGVAGGGVGATTIFGGGGRVANFCQARQPTTASISKIKIHMTVPPWDLLLPHPFILMCDAVIRPHVVPQGKSGGHFA
jgi:hypothetical protein